MDDPSRFGYLESEISTVSNSQPIPDVEMRSCVSSRELDPISGTEIALSSRELTRDRISTSGIDCELLTVEISLSRYPKRLGSSIGDQMVENGDLWRTSPRVG